MNKIFNLNSFGERKLLSDYLLTIMRVFILFIALGLGSVYASSSYAQTKIDINVNDATIEDLFKEIQNKSEFVFFYNDNIIDKNRKISLNLKNVTLSTILNKAFSTTDLSYKIDNRQVVIMKKEKEVSQIAFKKLNVVQTVEISGTILDASGQPLPGANILEKGTTNGTQSDFDGNFSLSVTDENAVLVVSFIGFATSEVSVKGSPLTIVLQEDLDALDEVVVVGYGTQSRAEVTGAIVTVDSEEITALPITSAEQALQGRAAGVSVVNTGSPGTGPVVRIRGLGTMNNNNPLYVIDGVISSGLGNINPSDIESINVLKDASTTAIYGSLGSNGVIMVTTKKGKSGEKVNFTLDSYTGTQYVTERFDLLNTQQYLKYANDAFGFVPTSALSSSGNDTDWQDALFQNGSISSVDFGASGGGENSNFRFSTGYLNQEGAVVETGFERFSFRANSNFAVGKFNFGETLSVSFNKQNPERGIFSGRSLLEHATKSAPYLPIYNENNLGGFQGPNVSSDGQDAQNPIRTQTLGHARNASTTILGNIYGEFEILKGLKLKSQVGLEKISYNFDGFVPSFNDDSEGATHTQGFAAITKNSGNNQTLMLTNSLNYKTTFNDVHNVEVLLLAETQDTDYNSLNTSSRNHISNEIEQVSNTDAFLQSFSGEYNRIGYLGRINYNFDQKYIFAASIRRDASSRFGKNNRWGTFPSVALGWNIAKEAFMADSNFNTFKLRGSWGLTGNDKIGDYAYSSTLLSNFFYPINGQAAVGTTANGIESPDLKWEETTMTNIGLDLGWMNNKITAAIEYFSNTSDDLLMRRPLSPSLGITAGFVAENVGSVDTKGFEFSLGYNDNEGAFTWSANINIGTSKNEVKSLGIVDALNGGSFEGSNISRISVGEPLFYFYGLQTDGIYDTQAEVDAVLTGDPAQTAVQPGDIRFVDQDGDGFINANDRVKIGNPYPDVTYGLNLNAEYKGFDFNMFITGVSGADVYNTNIYDLEGMTILFNSSTSVLNRWTGPGTSNSIPRAAGAPQNIAISDRFVEDGSYTRLKNITLGYNIDTSSLFKGVSKFRVYVSAQNLITFTDYSGLDPEIGSPLTNQNQFELGIDRGNYPQPKSVLLGIQVKF